MNWLIGWAALTTFNPAIGQRPLRPSRRPVDGGERGLKGLAAAEEQTLPTCDRTNPSATKSAPRPLGAMPRRPALFSRRPFHAAWVMRHSSDADDLKLALDAATAAMNSHVPRCGSRPSSSTATGCAPDSHSATAPCWAPRRQAMPLRHRREHHRRRPHPLQRPHSNAVQARPRRDSIRESHLTRDQAPRPHLPCDRPQREGR